MLLDNATTGIYIKLLSVLWIANNSLPLDFDQLARATLCETHEFLEAWDELRDKFDVASNKVSHPRFTAMIELREKRRASGSLGGNSRAANAKQTPSKDQANSKQSPSKVMKNEDRSMKNEDRSPKFIPPSIEDVAAYAKAKSLNLDEVAFCDFYISKGWKVGAAKMKDWKACARNWSRRNIERNASTRPQDVPRSVRMEQSAIQMANSLIAKQEQSCKQSRIEGRIQ